MGKFIGEITGHIRPVDETLTSSMTTDVQEWHVGPRRPLSQPFAIIDSIFAGSVMKFMQHSCANNCELFWRRVGCTRGLFVLTNKDVTQYDELTISYKKILGQPYRAICRKPRCRCAKISSNWLAERQKEIEAEPGFEYTIPKNTSDASMGKMQKETEAEHGFRNATSESSSDACTKELFNVDQMS
jgi:hypothetical protein